MHWLCLTTFLILLTLLFVYHRISRCIRSSRHLDLLIALLTFWWRGRRWWGRWLWPLFCLLRLFVLLLDYALVFSVCPLNYPLDNLVPLPFFASDGAIVDHIVQLDIVITDYFQLSMHWMLLHFLGAVSLGESQSWVIQRVHWECESQMCASWLFCCKSAQRRSSFSQFVEFRLKLSQSEIKLIEGRTQWHFFYNYKIMKVFNNLLK